MPFTTSVEASCVTFRLQLAAGVEVSLCDVPGLLGARSRNRGLCYIKGQT